MLRTPFVYLIVDSRANNFDAEKLYTQPEDFEQQLRVYARSRNWTLLNCALGSQL
jgi:tRNA A22 N-methylase